MRVAALLAFALAGCASMPLPEDQTASVLYRDLHRLVTLRTSSGWGIDRVEVDDLLPSALLSVCEVPPENRRLLASWVDERIDVLGGPIEEAYAKLPDLDEHKDLLHETRLRLLLDKSLEAADDDCPFWLPARSDFEGRQIQDDRWILSGGGGGKLTGVRQGDRKDVNFGGAGRLMIGRSFGRRWTVLVGAEVGGSAAFPLGDEGRDSLVLTVDIATPVAVRYRFENTYLEFESGYLLHVTERDTSDLAHGFRVGVAFGLAYSRQLFFIPGAAFGVAYERTLVGETPALEFIKAGFRVVFDISL